MTLKPLPEFVSFAPPSIGPEEIAEVAACLASGWLTTGPRTESFEKALVSYVGCRRAVPLSSCTAALHLSLLALKVGPGQGVITSPLTFASTGHVCFYVGARPFLVDIEPDTGNLCPEKTARFLERECRANGPEGRPVHQATGQVVTTLLPVHYGGHPVEMDAFIDLANRYNLHLVEDAAHALGAIYRGRRVGSWDGRPSGPPGTGHLAAFSFYATKNITTGEGGAAVGGDPELLEKVRILSMYGLSDARRIWGRYAPKGTWVYDVAELGYKYNMMDIQAALGLKQLEKLDGFIERRKRHAAIYNQALEPLADLVTLPVTRPGVEPAWHLYPLRLQEPLRTRRDELIIKLRELNVGCSVLFIPLHYHSFYQQQLPYRQGDFPEAEKFFSGLINLPLSPAHSPETIGLTASLTTALLKENRL